MAALVISWTLLGVLLTPTVHDGIKDVAATLPIHGLPAG